MAENDTNFAHNGDDDDVVNGQELLAQSPQA